jgi:hypothetical protein
METAIAAPLSFLQLIDPAAALAAAQRLGNGNLPHRICRPLDRRTPLAVNAELAAYDAEIEQTTIDEDAVETADSAE